MPDIKPHLSHPKYRADIDGLRALAVLAVVTFHTFPNWMKGGFIGVDVFFVISGYLISTILFENLDRGTFSFAEFYSRRIRRIFPAVILVLISCFAFGWFALLADEYKQLGKYVAAGAGFVSNLVLWGDAGYFDNSAETKLLLHLWSLGIEEQFYIVWPLLLWLAWKRKFNLFTITILVATISFVLNLKGVKQDAVATFYSPQTRFWELLAGSLLAWLTIYRRDTYQSIKLKVDGWLTTVIYREETENNGTTLANVLSVAGVALLAYGFWRINNASAFPGGWALIPVAGSLFLIMAGPKTWINRRILSNKLAVWFGLISFPLYLWHWPLLSFARIIESEAPSREIRIGLVLLSIVLSWTTYRLIERPIRFGRRSTIKTCALVALMAIVGYVGYNTYTREGLKFRNAEKASQLNKFDFPYRESCETITGDTTYGDDWCNKGNSTDASLNTVMIGDSFSNAYSPMLNFYANNADNAVKFVQFGRGQCPSLIGYGPDYCHLITNKSIEFIKQSQTVKTVILASNWPLYYSGMNFNWVKHIEDADSFKNALEKTIAALKDSNKKVVVFLPPPTGSNPKSCIIRPLRLTDKNICNLTLENSRSRDGEYRNYMIPLLDKLGIEYFDPFDVFCDEIECKVVSNEGEIFSADGMHMSVFGGEFLARNGDSRLRHILK